MPLFPLTAAQETADTVAKQTLTDKLSGLSELSGAEIMNLGTDFLVQVVTKIVIALAIYIIGRWLIRICVRFLNKIMTSRKVDISLSRFICSLSKIVLLLLLVTAIIGVLGINTTSFVALFASAGLAFGMALSGTLQNFAGGVMILLLKPFKAGDVVEMQGYTGIVKEIMLFNTLVNTFDNKAVLIPNGSISTGIINNYSSEQLRRVDWIFTISYGDDYSVAKTVIAGLLDADNKVLKDPAYFIALESLGDNSINIVVRAWVKSADYWDVCFGMNEKVYTTFPEKGLHFPFPQLDVHVKNS
ncbi:MAG: mechanosensitive ion channel [Rikenellaceae bacterium]